MFDLQKMMKQAQEMQKKMEAVQAELDTVMVEGTAGNGAVKVTFSAKMAIQDIKISPEAAGDAGLLEDMLKVAIQDAHQKADAATSEKMKSATGGLNIPGLKLPF